MVPATFYASGACLFATIFYYTKKRRFVKIITFLRLKKGFLYDTFLYVLIIFIFLCAV